MPRISIQNQKGNKCGLGRKSGSHNIFTMEVKKVMADIVAGELDNVKDTLQVVMKKKPEKYVALVLKIAEFVIPKTQQVELSTENSEGIDIRATLADMRGKLNEENNDK